MAEDLQISISMKDAGNTVDRAKKKLQEAETSAKNMDKAIGDAGRKSGNELNSSMTKVSATTGNVLSTVTKMAAAVGLTITAAKALSIVTGEIEHQAQMIREGFQGLRGDMVAAGTLKALVGQGAVAPDIMKRVMDMQASYASRGLTIEAGEYAATAAQLGTAAGLQGADVADSVRVAMELWARTGFKGAMADVATQLAITLATGQTRALRTSGIFLDETQYEGMETGERAQAIFKALQAMLSQNSALENMLNSQDMLTRELIASVTERGERGEFQQRTAADISYQQLAYQRYRAESYAAGEDPDSLMNLTRYVRARQLDPTATGWFDLLLKGYGNFKQWISGSSFKQRYHESTILNIDTRPPVRQGTE